MMLCTPLRYVGEHRCNPLTSDWMDLVVRVMLQPGVTQRKEVLVPKDSNPGLEITTFVTVRRQLYFIVYTATKSFHFKDFFVKEI